MRVLIAPDSFKGSISALLAAQAISSGWRSIRPDDEVVITPLADGGEGTMEAIHHVRGGEYLQFTAINPENNDVDAQWLLLNDGTAVVELASASGLPLLGSLAPLTAHTFGFGQLLRQACNDPRTKRIIATVGGSASTDGGTGALAALGFTFLDVDGIPIGLGGEELLRLESIDATAAISPPTGGVIVLTDVINQLTGLNGAAYIFSPQKGANSVDIKILNQALQRLAKVVGQDSDFLGAGAAGGTGYGLHTLWNATVTAGSEYVLDLMLLPKEIELADIVITGEGSLDDQSWGGKVIGAMSKLCQESKTPLIAIVGQDNTTKVEHKIEEVITLHSVAPRGVDTQNNPVKWLAEAGKRAAQNII